jgi:acetoin utilization deacetylase AcuC-like enzyme
VLTEEEEEDADLKDVLLAANKRSQLRSARMGLYQGTARELYKNESPEVVEEVERATKEANEKRAAGTLANDEEMTPLAYQQ